MTIRIGYTKDQLPAPGFKIGEPPRPVPVDRLPKRRITKSRFAPDPSDGDVELLPFWYDPNDYKHAEKAFEVHGCNFYPNSPRNLVSIYLTNNSGKNRLNVAVSHSRGHTDSPWMDDGESCSVGDDIDKYVGYDNHIDIWAHDSIPTGWRFPYSMVFAFPGNAGFVDIAITIKNWDR